MIKQLSVIDVDGVQIVEQGGVNEYELYLTDEIDALSVKCTESHLYQLLKSADDAFYDYGQFYIRFGRKTILAVWLNFQK